MRRICSLLAVILLALGPAWAGAELSRSACLDKAFTMLEEGNLFLERYNAATGAGVEPMLALGVPYLYGGNDVSRMLMRQPDYIVYEGWQKSVYYRPGTYYIYGLDCTGFIKWLYKELGKPIDDPARKLTWLKYHDRHVYCNMQEEKRLLPEDWTEVARTLQAGDLLVLHHPGLHAMVFIGTLRDYGVTAEEAPELADFLDYPLVIHCGTNPAAAARFTHFLETTENTKYMYAKPTDGGVSMALLGVPLERAPHHEVVQLQEQWWFELDEGRIALTLMDWDAVSDYAWLRF